MALDLLIPPWVKYLAAAAAVAALLCGAYHHGQSVEEAKWLLKEAQHTVSNQQATIRQQDNIIEATDARNKANDQTNARVLAMLDGLRNRPARSEVPGSSPADGQAGPGTGAALYREDGRFLAGEAARAETLRNELRRCYAAIDAGQAARAPGPTN